MDQVDGIEAMGGIHRLDVRPAIVLHLSHKGFQAGQFGTDGCRVDVAAAGADFLIDHTVNGTGRITRPIGPEDTPWAPAV